MNGEQGQNPPTVQGNNGVSFIYLMTTLDRQSNVETLKWYENRIRTLRTQCEEMESVLNRRIQTQCGQIENTTEETRHIENVTKMINGTKVEMEHYEIVCASIREAIGIMDRATKEEETTPISSHIS